MPTLVVAEQGAHLRCAGGQVLVELERTVIQRIPEVQLERVLVLGRAHLSTGFLDLAFLRRIPVTFLTQDGAFKGRLDPGASRDVAPRLAQFGRLQDLPWRLEIARRLVTAKIRSQRSVLQRARRSHGYPALTAAIAHLDALAEEVVDADSLPGLMGREGAAARCYFAALPGLLRERPDGSLLFHGRSRRPPRDPVNALLSLGYGLLSAELIGALSGLGLDPHIGVFPSTRGRLPALAQDLLELFRAPAADSLALALANLGVMRAADFQTSAEGGVYLNKDALPRYFRHYRRKMQAPIRGRDGLATTLRRELQAECGRMRRAIMGVETYDPCIFPQGGPDRGPARAKPCDESE